MAKVIDILDDPITGDIMIVDGDIVFGEGSHQHVKDLLLAQKGHYKQSPEAGIGIHDFINDDIGRIELEGIIEKQVALDGGEINKLNISGNDVIIEASYEV